MGIRWMAAAALLLAFLSICCVAQVVTFLLAPRNQRSNLDLRSERLVEAALEALLQGRTAIIVAHRLTTAMRADRIAVVERGRIVELGSHEELLERGGRYATMHDAWMQHAEPAAAS